MFTLIIYIFLLVIIYLYLEYIFVNKSIRKIPIRILVNGTRGKTTTVQIIFNTLRRSGFNVFAKTTGDQPIEYNPDGEKQILKRFAPASIIENIKLLHKWAKLNPDAIVIECMALHPENQFILSNKMFKPTHIIVTNIYQDHFEVMGDNIADISKTIFESFYRNAKIILSEKFNGSFYDEIDFVFTKENVFDQNYNNIPHAIINESWELILNLCKELELNIDIAKNEFHKIWQLKNDNIRMVNKEFQFELWNLFSVNDYESAKRFIDFIMNMNIERKNFEVIFNSRLDRPLRTRMFVPLIKEYFQNAKINITGSGKSLAIKLFEKSGCRNCETINLTNDKLDSIEKYDTDTIIIGIGNYKNMDTYINKIQQNDIGGFQ